MKKSQIDIPVALIFFNRPEQFVHVFEVVREVKPSKLFLIQDGPRPNNLNDVKNIQKCRDIINIDWECDIVADFSEENLGCGKRIFTGLSRCFEQVDRLVILEDDCIPSRSFFLYCQELLEKYKDDQRVGLITGMNHLNTFNMSDSDYFFANVGAIWGWATWKRCWDGVEFNLSKTVENSNKMRLLRGYEMYASHRTHVYTDVIEKAKQLQRGEKLSSWSTQFGINQILNSQLVVVPSVNLILNIGLSTESTNSPSKLKFIPRALRPIYQLDLFELGFPLRHPECIISDLEFNKRVDKILYPNTLIATARKFESVCLRLCGGDFSGIYRSIKRKLKRMSR